MGTCTGKETKQAVSYGNRSGLLDLSVVTVKKREADVPKSPILCESQQGVQCPLEGHDEQENAFQGFCNMTFRFQNCLNKIK